MIQRLERQLTGGPWAVLVGAGLSVDPPANVPAWWTFNQEVLENIVRSMAQELEISPELAEVIDSLTMDDLDIVHFSEIVHDRMFDHEWFDLLTLLRGDAPNDGHRALAELVKKGRVRCILSTNFDRLIETALDERGVPFRLLIPSRDPAPTILEDTDLPLVVKLHGSVEATTTLVDLVSQKSAGFDHAWRAWFRRTFEANPTLVAGFSGRDLQVRRDYLSMFAAAPRTPALVWLSKTGRTEGAIADALVRAVGPRGRVVEGRLPDFLMAEVGMPEVPPASHSPRASTVRDWFASHPRDPLFSAVAVAQVLASAGRPESAAEIRAAIRRHFAESYREMNLVDASRVVMAYVLLARDEPDIDRAVTDGTIAVRILSKLPPEFIFRDVRSREVHPAMLVLVGDLAQLFARAGDAEQEELLAGFLRTLIFRMPDGSAKWFQQGFSSQLDANRAARGGDFRGSAVAFREASTWFEKARASEQATRSLEGWMNAVLLLGERALAHEVGRRMAGADIRFIDHQWPRSSTIEELSVRAEAEWVDDGRRFDEVWFSLVAEIADLAHLFDLARRLLTLKPFTHPPEHVLLLQATMMSSIEIPLGLRPPRFMWVGELLSGPALFLQTVPEVHPRLVPLLRRLAQFYQDRPGDSAYWNRHDEIASAISAWSMGGEVDSTYRAKLLLVEFLLEHGQSDSAEGLLRHVEQWAEPSLKPDIMALYSRLDSFRA